MILTSKEILSAVITAVMSNKQSDRDDACRLIQGHILAVEAERDAREEECERKHAALVHAVSVIQTWHNMGIHESFSASELWDIYWRNAPEMKPIREAMMSSCLRMGEKQRAQIPSHSTCQTRTESAHSAVVPVARAALSSGKTDMSYTVTLTVTEYDALKARIAALEAAENRIRLNRAQVQEMLDYIDLCVVDVETEIIIGHQDVNTEPESGEQMPAGVYMWDGEYPEEGCMYLDPTYVTKEHSMSPELKDFLERQKLALVAANATAAQTVTNLETQVTTLQNDIGLVQQQIAAADQSIVTNRTLIAELTQLLLAA
jgi:regulator of replication initiation timing